MKIRYLIILLLVVSAYCKDFNVMFMRAKFPIHVFSKNDSIHFGPDEFDRSEWNAEEITDLDKFLKNGTSCTPSDAAATGYFLIPLMKIDFGGDTAFIVAEGDTNDIWIYRGKETWIYMYDERSKLLQRKYMLASGIAGEGPSYETDSWILDLNKDGFPDILTRHTGEWYDMNENGEAIGATLDKLEAVTWNDTGFVSLPVKNEDSLKQIYNVYFRHN